MATLNSFVPSWGEMAEWDEAYEKVENYLRAYRVRGKWHRADLTQRILSRLAATPPPLPRPALATLAIDTLEDHLDRWILRALPESDVWSRRQRFSTGRLTVLLCDAYSRWPEAFLAEDPMPGDMIQAMRSVLLMAGPNLQKGRMVPCPVDFGWATEWAGDAVGLFERRPFLKALLIWLLVVALLIYFFRITR